MFSSPMSGRRSLQSESVLAKSETVLVRDNKRDETKYNPEADY